MTTPRPSIATIRASIALAPLACLILTPGYARGQCAESPGRITCTVESGTVNQSARPAVDVPCFDRRRGRLDRVVVQSSVPFVGRFEGTNSCPSCPCWTGFFAGALGVYSPSIPRDLYDFRFESRLCASPNVPFSFQICNFVREFAPHDIHRFNFALFSWDGVSGRSTFRASTAIDTEESFECNSGCQPGAVMRWDWRLVYTVTYFFTPCPADTNHDGTVDLFDYDDFVDAFETGGIHADFNLDGFVDFFDYSDFVQSFEAGC